MPRPFIEDLVEDPSVYQQGAAGAMPTRITAATGAIPRTQGAEYWWADEFHEETTQRDTPRPEREQPRFRVD